LRYICAIAYIIFYITDFIGVCCLFSYNLDKTIAKLYNIQSKSSQSLAVWDHRVLPATRHKRTHPASTPARQAGTRFADHLRVEGWVSPGPGCKEQQLAHGC